MEEKKDKEVTLGGFIYTMSEEDGVITVLSDSKNWFIGYAPGTMAHTFLAAIVFNEDGMNEDDANAVNNFITSVYTISQIVDAETTIDVYKAIEKYMLKDDEEELSEEEDAKILKEEQTKHEIEKELNA